MDEQNTTFEGAQGKESYEAQKAERQQTKDSGRKNLSQKRNIRKKKNPITSPPSKRNNSNTNKKIQTTNRTTKTPNGTRNPRSCSSK